MSQVGVDPKDKLTEAQRKRIEGPGPVRRMLKSTWKPLAGAIVLFAVLYYPVGMAVVHKIDDDLDFRAEPNDVPTGASRTVATMSDLIAREVEDNGWTPNDPWFMPSAALDNMPNFQMGIVEALSRFSIELLDQIGRVRGSSGADGNLDKASGHLKISGTRWAWDLSVSWLPTTPAESEYMAARRELLAYNERLAGGSAVFDRRADNLQAAIERIAADLGSASQAIDDHVNQHAGGWWFDFKVDDEFYRIKGKSYAYYLLFRDLGHDYADVLAERNLTRPWNDMLVVMRNLAGLDPLVVWNGSPDGFLFPSHLATQGFYLLRARTKLKEISNILLK